MKSVEDYIGDSGKEFEGAAEKIVEGYMGEYMDKYMNEWYIKYCKDTGKYCDQIKVVHKNKENQDSSSANNHQSYDTKKTEQYYPAKSTFSPNQFQSSQKEVYSGKYGPQFIPNAYEKPQLATNYENYPTPDLQDMIEKDKYIHNNLPSTNQFATSQPMIYIPENNSQSIPNAGHIYSPSYKPGHLGKPRRNNAKLRNEKKRRARKQNRNRRPKPSVYRPKRDPYMDFEQIEDLFSGNLNYEYDTIHEQPLPYNKYNGYSAIEETDIDSIDRSYRPRY